ncbi:hypothetical protein V8G54_000302 [Vigna mungo]|uniref:Mutator-like transposase n=1 Tax=Vigna mungo TaxID=3915 RepID=A0AAQ3P8E7_VIGMU
MWEANVLGSGGMTIKDKVIRTAIKRRRMRSWLSVRRYVLIPNPVKGTINTISGGGILEAYGQDIYLVVKNVEVYVDDMMVKSPPPPSSMPMIYLMYSRPYDSIWNDLEESDWVNLRRFEGDFLCVYLSGFEVLSARRRPSRAGGCNELSLDVSEGHFVSDDNGNLKFDGEITQWSCDPDLFCYFGIIAPVKELGHKDIKEVWYSLGGQSVVPERLELLTDDRGVLHMVNIAMLNGEVHLYVVHNRTEPEIIEMIEWVDGAVNDEVHVQTQVEGEGEVQVVTEMQNGHGEGECEVVSQLAEGEVEREVEREVEKEIEAEVEAEVQGEVEVEGEAEVVSKLAEGELQSEVEREVEAEVEGEAEVVTQLAEGEVQREVGREVEAEGEGLTQLEEVEVADVDEVELEDVEDEDEDENREEDEDENVYESSSEESLVDVTIHCDNIGTSKRSLSEEQPCSSWTSGNDDMNDLRGISDNEWVSDHLDSGPDSEDEGSIPRTVFPTFSMPKVLEEYKWEVGTYFTEKNEFKEAIRTYALSNGRNLKFLKNDNKRVSVKCCGGNGKCKWYAYCAFSSRSKSWQLRKVIDDHTCSRDFNVKLITSKWLSKRMEKAVRENPNMKVMDIRDKVSRKWNVGISRNMAFRARAMAKDNVDGSFKEQYRRIYDYGHELLRSNPSSTVKIKAENINGECIFKRIYVCLKACKDSFSSCRPIIGVDGCFLKGKYGGELLTAVGRDGNEQILPIAYAVVEVENKDSWTWFLDLLIGDLGGEAICGACTFISDQQKCLLSAFQELLPGVEQRFCVRHLYSNFRKEFPGKDLKRLMWTAATATYPQLWEDEMLKIKDINLEAYKYLIGIAPRFTSRSQCDTLVNNMCEGFNSVLLHTRTKPIITMLEEIRVYIMKRWAKNRKKMALYQGSVCPKVLSRFLKHSWLTRYWLPRWSSDQLFEINHISQFGEQYVVNLDKQDCSCRKWLLTEDCIGTWYRKSTYEETYNSIVYPINGQVLWEKTPYPDVLPPKKRPMPGRPKKKRRLESWELKKNDTELRKGGSKKSCAICKQLGHNKRCCPQRPTTTNIPVDQPPAAQATELATEQLTDQTPQVTVPPPEQPTGQTTHVPAAE